MCLLPILLIFVPLAVFFFIRRVKDVSREGRSLYLATLFVEQACVLTRGIIAFLVGPALLMPVWLILAVVAGLVFLITKQFAAITTAVMIGLVILGIFALFCAIGPVVWSMLHIMGLTGSSKFDRWVMKARTTLSDREREALVNALLQIPNATSVKMFSNVYVMASWHTERFEVIGTDLYLAKKLLHGSQHLPAVLAHALGWVNSGDGRMVIALRRLVVPPMYLISWALNETAPGNMIMHLASGGGYAGFIATSILNAALALSGGGWGAYLLNPWWNKYWNNEAVYRHDAFAKALGQKQGLIAYLEHQSLFTVATPYTLFSEDADPEMRIDALMK